MRQIMENDLISREALKMAVRESYYNNPHPLSRDKAMHRHEHNHMIEMIEAAPAVDAVEVVRCKDCKKCIKCTNGIICSRSHGLIGITENDFCSYGERRTHNG